MDNNDMDSNGPISNTNDASNDSCANNIILQSMPNYQSEMKSISMEEYRNLLNATIELYKANATIKKLESLLQQKDDKIKNLDARLDELKIITDNLSPVSLEFSNVSIKLLW